MKLLFLAPANSIHSARWIRWFASAGHEVTWISAHPLEVAQPPGLTLHLLPRDGGAFTRWSRWLRAVRRIVRAARPDVVHVHSLGTYAVLAFGVPSGVPMVSTPWGSDIILDANSSWRRAIVRRTLGRSAFCTSDAQHMRPRLAALGVDASRVHIINFGVETERFVAIASDRVAGAAVGPPGAGAASAAPLLRVISLRMLDPIYDIPTLIRAAARLKRSGIGLVVDIHGSGPEGGRLEAQVRELALEGIVTFHGRYSHDTLPSILAGADVYVSTSTSDAGIAASTAEAMASGLPVAISDSGENTAWITDGVNGRLFPTGNDEVLAAILEEAAANPERRRAWAEA
ncbi:MAG: glycosyltransferase, partial [Proteobacteria bacterium]|nr:glycosyltransferase [Pseudomonadota bacterium]